MQYFWLIALAVLLAACHSTRSFSDAEIKKLDARLYAAVQEASSGGSQRAQQQTRFSCIIYTDDVEAVRRAGVEPGTVTSRFVTATVTLEQLRKLVSYPEVKYIEAGSRNLPQEKQ